MSNHGRSPEARPRDRSRFNPSRPLPSTPSSGHPGTRLHKLSSRQNMFPAVPGTATIRAEKDGR
ncbi:hypothetical protein TIFTF001_021086 [Ficus carica]|uniref:Uncharacterized protein n=1 Tax=Ficus carica TaxID=3494 RepID=A0AA88AUM8_FICCA|nr:hypothetical protein TIFTF001_021086 [Ficus carica]